MPRFILHTLLRQLENNFTDVDEMYVNVHQLFKSMQTSHQYILMGHFTAIKVFTLGRHFITY